MMIPKAIPKVHVSWLPFDTKVILFHLITYPIKSHVHVLGTFFFIVPLMIPSNIYFSVMISVAGCGWPIYSRVVLSASNSLEL